MGYMYEGVIQSNELIFRGYQITQLNAGVITRDTRSIKLISQLSFNPTDNFQKMEINGKLVELKIYNLIKPDSETSLLKIY